MPLRAPGRCTTGKVSVPIVLEAGWASGPVWTCVKNLAPTGIRSPDRSAPNQSLYRLSYLGPVIPKVLYFFAWAVKLSRYSEWLRDGRFGDRIPVGARFFASVQTGPATHPFSCTMGTGSFPGVESARGVTVTPTPF
jgi:hypothetical protein